ncbi:MAG: hypothetical protein KDA83_17080 [Planctomycetales bacterium]|nr:hypothetical protein [Planctomycetales bacterium]
MWNETIKRTTLLPLVVLAVSLVAIYGKQLRQDSLDAQAPESLGTAATPASLASHRNGSEVDSIDLPAIYRSGASRPRSRVQASPVAEPWASPSSEAEVKSAADEVTQSTAAPSGADPRVARDSNSPSPESRDSIAREATDAATSGLEPMGSTSPNFQGPHSNGASLRPTSPRTLGTGLGPEPDLMAQVQRQFTESATEQGGEPRQSLIVDDVRMEAGRIAELMTRIDTQRPEAPVSLSQEFQAGFLERISKAQGLARKGALFAADQELTEALEDLASNLDGIGPRHDHAEACAIGVRALREASDFFEATRNSNDPDRLRLISHRHATFRAVVPDSVEIDKELSLEAYYSVALTMLTYAAGNQPIAAEAFVSLGKLHAIAPSAGVETLGPFQAQLPVPKSLVYHQVALRLQPDHAVAANELAVQVGKLGQWTIARDLLVMSLRSRPTPAAWRNLAEAHARLGEPRLADLARREAEMMLGQRMIPTGLANAPTPVPSFPASGAPMPNATPAPRNAQQGNGVPFFSGVR